VGKTAQSQSLYLAAPISSARFICQNPGDNNRHYTFDMSEFAKARAWIPGKNSYYIDLVDGISRYSRILL
jgi:hypothetical protein